MDILRIGININKSYKDKLNLKEIGPILKTAREEKNISIEELSESLKISQDYIKSIESGEKKYLPEKVYVKAMIQKISDKLQINSSKSSSNIYANKKDLKKELKSSNQYQYKLILNIILYLITMLLGVFSSRTIFKNIQINNYQDQQNKINTTNSQKLLSQLQLNL